MERSMCDLLLTRANLSTIAYIMKRCTNVLFTTVYLLTQSISVLWPVLISSPAEGRRLSWSGWLGEILRWFAHLKMVTHPVLAAAAGNQTPDHRASSPAA